MEAKSRLRRIRSASQAIKEIKRIDPETRIREHHIRAMMRAKKVTVIHSGERQFVDLDELLEYCSRADVTDLFPPKSTEVATIRRIAE